MSSWGFDIVLYPTGAMRAAVTTIKASYDHPRGNGDTIGFDQTITALDAFNELVGIGRYRAIDNECN